MPDEATALAGTEAKAPEAPLACDLLVFDLDGTLINSEQDLANTVNATLAYLGRPHLNLQQVASFIGDGAGMLVRRALDATIATDGRDTEVLMTEALPFFLDYYRHHLLDFTYVYPGVISALKAIRTAAPHLPMAILTNKPVRPSRGICDSLGLSEYFFQNYGGDSFTTKKPDPLGLHTLMKEASTMLGRDVSPQRTVLVGDSHVDAETARNAGILCLGCLYGLAPDSLRASNPSALTESPHDWLTALQSILPKA